MHRPAGGAGRRRRRLRARGSPASRAAGAKGLRGGRGRSREGAARAVARGNGRRTGAVRSQRRFQTLEQSGRNVQVCRRVGPGAGRLFVLRLRYGASECRKTLRAVPCRGPRRRVRGRRPGKGRAKRVSMRVAAQFAASSPILRRVGAGTAPILYHRCFRVSGGCARPVSDLTGPVRRHCGREPRTRPGSPGDARGRRFPGRPSRRLLRTDCDEL